MSDVAMLRGMGEESAAKCLERRLSDGQTREDVIGYLERVGQGRAAGALRNPQPPAPPLPAGIRSAADTEREMDRVERSGKSTAQKIAEYDRLNLTESWEFHARGGK